MANMTSITEGRRTVAVRPTRRGSTSSRSCCWWPASAPGSGSPVIVASAAGRPSWGRSWDASRRLSPQIAQQWERAVVLRLGNYTGLRGPGLFWIIPGIDRVSSWIDQRIITTSFAAEETLTSDTVPVNVDAVLFWMVLRPREGGAGGPGLQARGELGGADGAPRHHRPDAADRPAPRPRADRGRSSRS